MSHPAPTTGRPSPDLEPEQLTVRLGARSGLTLVVAVHDLRPGQALGGCRLRHYPDWWEAAADAVRLAEGMSRKCAAAGLPHGGGKAVIVAPASGLRGARRRAALHDLGDLVTALGGAYATGPDLGTGPADMVTVRERTRHVFCLPAAYGGSGDSSPPTARGVLAAVTATCEHRYGSPELAGRRCTVIGLGAVGARIAGLLAQRGARVAGTDLDPRRRRLAARLGVAWLPPETALDTPTELLVPAAVGGLLTHARVRRLRADAVVGPANNQLAADDVAEALHARGILWVPDYLASAGGVVHATAVELRGRGPHEALAEVEGIGDRVRALLTEATRAGVPPHTVARRLAARRPAAAQVVGTPSG